LFFCISARPAPPDRTAATPLQPIVDDIVLVDPVCGMTVDRASARHLAEHDGAVYAFCSIGCRTRFMKDPPSFLAAPGTHSMEST
jgi:YHS domain-containing protein